MYNYKYIDKYEYINIVIYRVRTGFVKLWKLMIQFSRTWRVLVKETFFKTAIEKFWIFVWGNSKIALKWI